MCVAVAAERILLSWNSFPQISSYSLFLWQKYKNGWNKAVHFCKTYSCKMKRQRGGSRPFAALTAFSSIQSGAGGRGL